MSPCGAHRLHRPRVTTTDRHHLHPLGLGGPDTLDNIVVLCPTGHRNVHRLLAAWLSFDGAPPWPIRAGYHPAERALAAEGFRLVDAHRDRVDPATIAAYVAAEHATGQ